MKNKINQKPDFIFHSKNERGIRRHTVVGVVEGKVLKIGHSVTSDGDTFVKKLGVNIALGRALKNPIKTLEWPVEDLTKVKDEFYKSAKGFKYEFKILTHPQHYLTLVNVRKV